MSYRRMKFGERVTRMRTPLLARPGVRWALVAAAFVLTLVPTMALALSNSREEEFAAYDIMFYDPEDMGVSGCANISLVGSGMVEKLWYYLHDVSTLPSEVIAGLLGNIVNEGSGPTRHEDGFFMTRRNGNTYNLWQDNAYVSGSISGSAPYYTLDKLKQGSYGIGIVQWSFGRRVALLEKYRSDAPHLLAHIDTGWETYGRMGYDELSQALGADVADEHMAIQASYILYELAGSHASAIAGYENMTVEEAAYAIATKYEIHGGGEASNARRVADARAIFDKYNGLAGRPETRGEADVIYLGDSRFVGMCSTIGLSNCVAETGGGLAWLQQTGAAKVTQILQSNPNRSYKIVTNLGVNDTGNAASYATLYKSLLAGDWKGHELVIAAVSPVDETLARANGYATITNAAIQSFNINLQNAMSGSGASFCDSTANVAYTGSDGVHYDEAGQRNVFAQMTQNCGIQDSGTLGQDFCNGAAGATATLNDGFVVYSQNDPRWNDAVYGANVPGCSPTTIGAGGCGLAALAMIVTSLTGQSVTPLDVEPRAVLNGSRAGCYGSSVMGLLKTAEEYGLQWQGISSDINTVNQWLQSGALILISGSGSAPFTGGGHYIVIRGIAPSGKWLVGDSNGTRGEGGVSQNNWVEWEPSAIMSQQINSGPNAIFR